MNIEEFKTLHKNLCVRIPKTPESNSMPSDTDPTQDIPLRMVEVNALGAPVNVKERKVSYNNLKAENLSTIEKRNNDAFDQLGELQDLTKTAVGSGVSTDYKPIKKQKKHEF